MSELLSTPSEGSVETPTTTEAVVLPFEQRHVERINGVRVNLGRMTLDELVVLEHHCYDRLEDAKTDHYIVLDEIARRTNFPKGDGPEAA